MTDRELLELAAKAAGLETKWDQLRGAKCGSIRARIPGSGCLFPIWSPLTDDGDALRLAVKLGFSIERHTDASQPHPWLRVVTASGAWIHAGPSPDFNSDPYAATRRAIVRAAAAIAQEQSHD